MVCREINAIILDGGNAAALVGVSTGCEFKNVSVTGKIVSTMGEFCKQSCNQACIFAGRYMLHGTCNQSGQVQRSVTAVEFSFFCRQCNSAGIGAVL